MAESYSVWATVIKYHRWVAYKQQKFISCVLEAGMSKVEEPAWSPSDEGPFPGS